MKHEYIQLKTVVEFVRNGANIKQDKNCYLGIPITRIETLSNSNFNYDKLGYANIFDDKYQNYYLLNHDVLLSHINSEKFLGRSVLYISNSNVSPIIHGMNLLCIRFVQDKYNPSFFVWYSKSQVAKEYFKINTKRAVNQASITSSAIKEMPIPNITLSEQNRIVAELDKIQSAIDNKRQQLAKLDELVNSKFYEMFECKNYPISTIGECCTLKSGTTFKKELELESGDYMYIKVSDMNLPGNEKYIRTSKTYVSSSSIKNFAIPGNSIIFPKRGGAIATNKKRITQNTICVDLNTMAVTPNSTLNLDYLYQFFVNIDMGKFNIVLNNF